MTGEKESMLLHTPFFYCTLSQIWNGKTEGRNRRKKKKHRVYRVFWQNLKKYASKGHLQFFACTFFNSKAKLEFNVTIFSKSLIYSVYCAPVTFLKPSGNSF